MSTASAQLVERQHLSHQASDLVRLFDGLFTAELRTRLCFGSGEPEYIPHGGREGEHQVVFAHGFFASALHEVAHWCVAGAERRKLPDYGYWYRPDGRSPDEQRQFQLVEIKPQALEWIFATAAGARFHFSADNLTTDQAPDADLSWQRFQEAVQAQVLAYIGGATPRRALHFTLALAAFYGTRDLWREPSNYTPG